MSTSKRIISLLLALVMVLGMLPWDTLGVEATGSGEVIHVVEEPVKLIQTEEPVVNSDGIAVTRAQWLQMLVEVFDYHIEDEIVPDNYFTDLHEDAEYYEDILVAVYYGLVDVLPNSPMEPEAAATREFVVSTLNACMGYLPEGEPSFAEVAEVTYPDDIQVALEQGWFDLKDGAFLPQQPITTEEFTLLQVAAESYVEEFTIVPTESQYAFKEGIIEITDEADISTVDGVDIVTVANLSKAIAPGDKFVVYSSGLAIPYLAEAVAMDGVNTIITTSDLEFDDAIETMIVQQETDADPANYYASEDTDLIFIEEESGKEYSQQAVVEQMGMGSTKVYIPKFSKKIDLGDGTSFTLSVELKNAKVFCDSNIGLLNGNIALWLDTDVEVSGKISCDLSKFSNTDIEIYIGGYEVKGVGGLNISLKMDATGSISVVKKFHMLSGIRVAYDLPKLKFTRNYVFTLIDKGSTVNAEISAKICLEAKFGLYGKALPLKGYVSGEAGFKMKLKRTTYSEISGNCTHFSAHLYAEVGAKVEWKVGSWKDSFSYKYDLIKEEESPVRLSFHYEDGKQVGQCTRKGLTGTSTGDSSAIGDSGYVTGAGSNYSGSGLSSGGSSQGYGSNGEPVIIYTYSLDSKNNATITSYKGNATSLTIPLMLDGYPVTAIGDNAFKNKTSLHTVIMQDNILSIGYNAFSGCSNLRNLTLSEGLTEMGNNAFQNCSSLTTATIPDGVTRIGWYAFAGCTSMQQISIPDSVTTIESYAFANSGLKSLKLPKNLVNLGNSVLSGNTGVKEITIPKTVESMGYSGYGTLGNSSIEKLVFEEGITKVPDYAAKEAASLVEVSIPSSVVSIESYAFADCTSLAHLDIPNSVTTIGWYAFDGCASLQQISIPDSVTTIESYAFANSGLKSLKLPKNLVNLGNSVLSGNTGVKEITIPKTVESMGYSGYGTLGNSSIEKLVFEEGITKVPGYAAKAAANLVEVSIPSSVVSIESDAFADCTSLAHLDIPNSVTTIGWYAFDGCASLQQISIPDSVTTIESYAFANSGLKSLKLPKNLVNLGYSVLSGNTGVKEITIPKTVESMGYSGYGTLGNSSIEKLVFEEGITKVPGYAAKAAANLVEVSIPSSVVSIESDAFADCTSLAHLDIPNSVTTIGWYAFDGCASLQQISIPDSVTTIESYAFANSGLKSLEVPDHLLAIKDSTFANCDSLTTINIPTQATAIGNSAFYDCDALTSITIPYGVTSIGSSAFYDCDALETVDMANSVISLGSSAFKHCDVLKNVKLSRNLTSIPSETFRECAELEQIVIPYFTTKIEANAFNSSPKLTKVVVHEKLASINTSAFSYADRTVFYGPTGSYTNTWCTDNGYSFVENTAATTKVTAAESSVTIPKGKTYMLDFDIDPIDFHEVITTKSSNTAVATVDETGKITAVAPGTATIKIIVGGASASCKVTVTQAVTKITLNKTKLSLDVPQTYQLTATITPSDASNKTLNWTSSNPAAATVDANGLVTAVGNGTAVIKAESTDGTGISASCTVTVIDPSKIPVSGIALDKTSLSLEAMEDYQLTATVSPANAANKGLVWSSSNEAVATVDSNGKVTAVAKGTATITAAAADGYGAGASCTVTVTNNGYLVTDLTQFQSSHPYADRCTDFWIYRQSGAGSLSITFAAETEIEDGFDYLYIYDGEGNLIGKYTGTELANQTITIPGDTVKVQIESDDSGNAWGFQVVDVEYTDHNHSFTNYISDGNATCTEDGTKTAKCDHCDLTDTIADVGSALGHNMGAWNTVRSATCTENGEEQRNCTRCDHSESRTIEAVGHRWDNGVVTREPTEETEGERLYTCTACGATRTESIPVIGHEHSYETIVTAPTCTEQGYTTYTCRCGESYTADYVDALGHAWGDWIVIQEPTTTENGVEEHICTRCGHAEQRSIAKLENPFNDVAPGSFFYEPVMWAIENGITSGTTPTTFGPNDKCMRAHVVTFLWRAVGSPEPTRTDNPFVDVKSTDFYYKPVLWAVENGITSGMDATHFGPTAYCNRAQVVTFLYRTMGNPAVGAATNPFTDVAAGSFYGKPVLWAVENGVTAGLSATSFGPNSICNRAQIVTFLYRAFVD